MSRPQIRPMDAGDASRVTELCAELGYPVSRDDVAQRVALLSTRDEHALVVAERDGRVVGWVHAFECGLLLAAPFAEIGGLVVGDGSRRRGVGRALLAAVEAWASERGCAAVAVRSNVVRDEAHRFYPALGYRLVKTSHVYEKALRAEEPDAPRYTVRAAPAGGG